MDIIFAIVLVGLNLAIFLFFESISSMNAELNLWVEITVSSWGYFGAGLIALLGNFTVLLPIPYVLGIFSLGAQPSLNPLIIGLVTPL